MPERMTMLTGISTASFYDMLNTEEAITEMVKLAPGAAEVFLGSYSEYEPEFISMLLDRIDGALDVYSVHSLSTTFEPQLFSRDTRQRQDSELFYRKVLEGTARLGAQVYVFHGPAILKRTLQRRSDFAWLGECTSRIADIAGEYGIKLGFENVHWCMYSYAGFAAELKKHTMSDNLYFTLDIKQAVQSGDSINAYIADMGDRLINVHICDYRVEAGSVSLHLPGRGECDFGGLCKALALAGYNGPMIMEVYANNYQSLDELYDCYRTFEAGVL